MKEIKWGLIFIVAIILWMMLEKAAGLHAAHIQYHAAISNFFALLAIIIFIFALRDKRQAQPGAQASWSVLFFCGLKISVVIAILSPPTQWLIHTIISPEFFPNMRTYAIDSGMMSEARANDYFTLDAYMFQSAVFAFGMGIITSAVVAFFLKRSRASVR